MNNFLTLNRSCPVGPSAYLIPSNATMGCPPTVSWMYPSTHPFLVSAKGGGGSTIISMHKTQGRKSCQLRTAKVCQIFIDAIRIIVIIYEINWRTIYPCPFNRGAGKNWTICDYECGTCVIYTNGIIKSLPALMISR